MDGIQQIFQDLQNGQVKEIIGHLFSYGFMLGDDTLFPRSSAEQFAAEAKGKMLTGTKYKVIDTWLEGDEQRGVVVGHLVLQESQPA